MRTPKLLQRGESQRLVRPLIGPTERTVVKYQRTRRRELILHRTNYTSRPPVHGATSALTVFDLIHEKYPEYFVAHDKARAIRTTAITSSELLIAISAYTRDQLLERYPVDPARVHVVHLGSTRLDPCASTLASLQQAAPFLLYVGSRGGYKNFERFLRAFAASEARLEGIHVRAFGGGTPSTLEHRLCEELGISDLVEFSAGTDAVLAAHYATALALIYPSLDEGFGLPPLEAMHHGCAVVASHAGSIPEIVRDCAILVDPMSIDSIAEGIDTLLHDEQRCASLRVSGVDHARTFTWDATASATRRAYCDVLGISPD